MLRATVRRRSLRATLCLGVACAGGDERSFDTPSQPAASAFSTSHGTTATDVDPFPAARMCTILDVATTTLGIEALDATSEIRLRMRSARRRAQPQGTLATGDPNWMWRPGDVVRVFFVNGDAALQARVFASASQWMRFANLRFVRSDDPSSEIRIAFTDDGNSWSLLGRDALNQVPSRHTMQLGWLRTSSSDAEVDALVLHQFGHALGLVHEHPNPLSRVPWDVAAVEAYYERHYDWDAARVREQVLERYDRPLTQFARHDPTSIMRYAIDDSLTIGDFEVPWNTRLSTLDKSFVRAHYPRAGPRVTGRSRSAP